MKKCLCLLLLLGLVVTSGCGGSQSGESNTEAKPKGFVVLTDNGHKKFVNDFCPEAYNFNDEYNGAKAKVEEYFTKELYKPERVYLFPGQEGKGDVWRVGVGNNYIWEHYSLANYTYIGPLVNDRPEGFGVIYNEIPEFKFPRKYIYIGNFKNGMFDGYGLTYDNYVYPNLTIYDKYSKSFKTGYSFGDYTYGENLVNFALGGYGKRVPMLIDRPIGLAEAIANDYKYSSMSNGQIVNYIQDIESEYNDYDLMLEVTNGFYYNGMINGLIYEGQFKDGVANGRGNVYRRENFIYIFDSAKGDSEHMENDKEYYEEQKEKALETIDKAEEYIEKTKKKTYLSDETKKQKLADAEETLKQLKEAMTVYDRMIENCDFLMEPVSKPTFRYRGNLYVISGNFNNGIPKGRFVGYRQSDTYGTGYKFFEVEGVGNKSNTCKMWLQDGTLLDKCNYKNIWKHVAHLNKVEVPHFVDFELEVPEG